MDEQGKPPFGDVFGIQQQEAPVLEEDEQIERQPWGELESESEEESESEVCWSGLGAIFLLYYQSVFFCFFFYGCVLWFSTLTQKQHFI